MRNDMMLVAGVVVAMAGAAMAAPPVTYVNALGSSTGWYSDDTRTSAGVYLNGTNSSFQPYFQGLLPSSTADDALIAQQLYFTESGSAAGGESGGVMVLDGTSANLGKTSVRYYGAGTGIGTLDSSFTSTFRWYMDPYPTSRTVALNLSVLGTNGLFYSMSWLGTGAQMNAWQTFSVDSSTDGWRIYGNGAPGSTGSSFTLSSLLADATYGSILSGASVIGQGFNIGSYQRNARVGIDWLESSLINGGTRVDFGVIPAPGAIALLGLAGVLIRRRKA
ncbi:MAG: hypothetical protein ACO32J_08335 [Phycisphaerales bacterium]